MIQDYKNEFRYWVATRIGDLQTAREDHIVEIICPDCGMKTALDSESNTKQSCYFCDGDLLQKDEATEEPTASMQVHNESSVEPSQTEATPGQKQEAVKQIS